MYVTRERLNSMSEYDKYVHYCDAYGIKPDSKKVYEVSQREAKRRGKDISPAEYARRQLHDDLSDKEIMARYKVEVNRRKLTGQDDITLGEFMRNKGWKEIDEYSSKLYEQEKDRLYREYKKQGFSDADALKFARENAGRFVSYQVYGSEY